jgi:hypothetical protein
MVALTLEMAELAAKGSGRGEQDQQCADAGAIVVT